SYEFEILELLDWKINITAEEYEDFTESISDEVDNVQSFIEIGGEAGEEVFLDLDRMLYSVSKGNWWCEGIDFGKDCVIGDDDDDDDAEEELKVEDPKEIVEKSVVVEGSSRIQGDENHDIEVDDKSDYEDDEGIVDVDQNQKREELDDVPELTDNEDGEEMDIEETESNEGVSGSESHNNDRSEYVEKMESLMIRSRKLVAEFDETKQKLKRRKVSNAKYVEA
ncbi:hypothetical protein HDU76_009886, partial [Blyttiomyces sp. JEL0837]